MMKELTHNAEDLVLYIDNTSDLYFSIREPLNRFLTIEMKKGSYVRDLARKGFSLLIDHGIESYKRELKIVGKTSRLSYVVFTIIALLIMMVLSVTEWRINMVFTAAMIYFSHILPASILVIKNRKEDKNKEIIEN